MAYGEMFPSTSLSTIVESTFTPTIIGTSTAGAGTYSVQIGRYKVYNNMTYFFARCTWSAHTGTGDMEMGTYPYSPAAATVNQRYFKDLTLTDGTNTYDDMECLLVSADDNIQFQGQKDGGTVQLDIDSSGDVMASGGVPI